MKDNVLVFLKEKRKELKSLLDSESDYDSGQANALKEVLNELSEVFRERSEKVLESQNKDSAIVKKDIGEFENAYFEGCADSKLHAYRILIEWAECAEGKIELESGTINDLRKAVGLKPKAESVKPKIMGMGFKLMESGGKKRKEAKPEWSASKKLQDLAEKTIKLGGKK